MNKEALSEMMSAVASNAVKASNAVDDGLMARVRDGMSGHPKSPSFDAGSSTAQGPRDDDASKPKEYVRPELRGKPTNSDPTGSAAVQALNYGDRGAQDAKDLIRLAKAMHAMSEQFIEIASRYNARQPSVIDRGVSSANDDPGCVSCARVEGFGGKAWWNPATRKTTLANGLKVGLCNWCYETPTLGARWDGILPPVEAVAAQRDGKPVRRSA